MVRKRARLTDDNDPLSSTDEVLAGFQQLSQSASQPADKLESQLNDQLTSKKVNKSTRKQADKSNIQEVELRTGQDKEEQQVNQSTRCKVKKLTRQLAELTPKEDKNMTSLPDNNKASQLVDKSKLRKVTFQIQESVVNCLDKLHLQLQLELGKANAPYKEVIVEEAISRLLESVESNREELVEVLQERQNRRKS